MSSNALCGRLTALGMPGVASFDLSDHAQVVRAVAFLEDRKIRHRKPAERAGLRTPGDVWAAEFSQYLAALGCPLLRNGKSAARTADPAVVDGEQLYGVLMWLAGHALMLEFEDRAQAVNQAAAAQVEQHDAQAAESKQADRRQEREEQVVAAAAAAGGTATVAPASDQDLESMRSATSALARALGAPEELSTSASGAETVEQLARCARAVGHHVLARVAPDGKKLRPAPTAVAVDKAIFPVGFATGDVALDEAARALRMLYISDLRELQDAANDIIVAMQEFTANPKTDASLGKVGR